MEEIKYARHPVLVHLNCCSNGEIYSDSKGLLIQKATTKCGYIKITTTKGTYLKHRLIMEAFFGFSQLTVDHINGVKTDNRLKNLEYVSNAENLRRSFATGTRLNSPLAFQNYKHGREKLTFLNKKAKNTFEEISQIRKMHEDGVSSKEICKIFNLSSGGVSKIIRNQRRVEY